MELNDDRKFNVSYGLDPVLQYFEKQYSQRNSPYRTILINLATCIRNSLVSKETPDTNLILLDDELITATNLISTFWGQGGYTGTRLIFYIYKTMDFYTDEDIRPNPPSKKVYENTVNEMCKRLTKISEFMVNQTYVKMICLDPKYGSLTHQLEQLLFNTNTDITSSITPFNGYYYITTHLPLDFHILNQQSLGLLISSHKSEPLDRKQLGQKVFLNEDLPFNMLTHFIFGDKYQVKPDLTIAQRKAIKEKAKQRKWHIRTESEILNDLSVMGLTVKRRT